MKSGGPKTFMLTVLLIGAAAGLGWVIFDQFQSRSGSRLKQIGAGVIWPVVSHINREFAWFSICFLSSAIVLGAAYIVLNNVIGSTFFAILILGVLRTIPVVSSVVKFPQSLICGLLGLLIANPLGCKPPTGMERLNR